jgi:hypothetical protein
VGAARGMTDHTRPERAAELMVCRRIRERIRSDPCSFCFHRDTAWGISRCKLAGRQYPQCLTDGRALQFEFDPTTVPREA